MALALFSTANIIFIVVMHVILAEIAGTGLFCAICLWTRLGISEKNVAELQCDMAATASALIIHEDVALFELQNAREIDFLFSRRILGDARNEKMSSECICIMRLSQKSSPKGNADCDRSFFGVFVTAN